MTKRIASYSRVSYYDREGESLDSQREMCREYAQLNGYRVVVELSEDDRGASGADADLPALNQALALAGDSQIDILVTRELDRFARSLAKQLIIEDKFRSAGVDIEYVIGEYPDTPEGQLNKHIRAVIAEYERLKINERMRRGRTRSARRGNVLIASNPPYGYRLVKTEEDGKRPVYKLQIIEDEAEIVRQIFNWYAYGDGETLWGVRTIARELTTRRVLTATDKGKNVSPKKAGRGHWSGASVHRILSNSTYAGEWVYNSDQGPITVQVEPIIDRALFERVQRRLTTAKRTSRRNTKYDYLLRGRIACAECNYHMTAVNTKYRGKDGMIYYFYYRCPGSQDSLLVHNCDATACRADYADAVVWQEIKGFLRHPERLAEAHQRQRDSDQEPLENEVERLDKRIAGHKAQLGRLIDLYVEGLHTQETVQERHQQIENAIERLEKQRAALLFQLTDSAARRQQVQDIQEFAREIGAGIEAADEDFQRRRWIVETLDVTVRLERRGDDRVGHVELGGAPLSSVSIVSQDGRHKR